MGNKNAKRKNEKTKMQVCTEEMMQDMAIAVERLSQFGQQFNHFNSLFLTENDLKNLESDLVKLDRVMHCIEEKEWYNKFY